MALKDLFIKSDESPDDKPIQKPPQVKKDESIKFPSNETAPVERTIPKQSAPKTPTFDFGFGTPKTAPEPEPMFIPTPNLNVPVSQEQIDKAFAIYKKGFDSLNTDGYDFYEYYTMVLAGGIENTPIYAMAYAMGKSVSPSITKEALVAKADYYIDEINKVYQNFTTQGNAKMQSIATNKSNEKQSLVQQLESVKQQMEALEIEKASCEKKLGAIDSNYAGQLNEVETMLSANSIAKDKIVGSIQTVKNGVINNVN